MSTTTPTHTPTSQTSTKRRTGVPPREVDLERTTYVSRGFRGRRPTEVDPARVPPGQDRKSTRLNSSHLVISYAVFCLKKKKKTNLSLTLYTHGYDFAIEAGHESETQCERSRP